MHSHRRAGFSVIELVIFLAALVVLLAIAAPRLVRMHEQERHPVRVELVTPLPEVLQLGEGDSLAFRVIGRNGEPVATRRVELRSSGIADSISPARPHTDGEGVARVHWRAQGEPGERVLRVTVPGTEVDTSFTAQVTPPGAAERAPARAPAEGTPAEGTPDAGAPAQHAPPQP